DLARQAHLVLVADRREHAGEGEAFQEALGTEVLHALLDQHAAGAAGPVAEAVEVAVDAAVNFNTGLTGFVAQVGAFGDLDLFLFVDEHALGHGTSALLMPADRSALPRREEA